MAEVWHLPPPGGWAAGQPVHQVDHARVGVAGLGEEGTEQEGDPPDAAW